MEKILNVTQYVFDEYKRVSGEIVDEMKLHKLLYFVQRESIAILGVPMFEEPFEGWKYGPVSRIVRFSYTPDGIYDDNLKDISDDAKYIVNNVIAQYGAIASWKLSDISHKEISWLNARKGIERGENGSVELKIEDIMEDAKKVRPYDTIWDMFYDEFEDIEVVE